MCSTTFTHKGKEGWILKTYIQAFDQNQVFPGLKWLCSNEPIGDMLMNYLQSMKV